MTNDDGMMRRGAATDLMEQVGDALAAPWVASVAGEKSIWWSPEKGVRTKKAGQSGEGRNGTRVEIAHYTYLTRWSWRIRRL